VSAADIMKRGKGKHQHATPSEELGSASSLTSPPASPRKGDGAHGDGANDSRAIGSPIRELPARKAAEHASPGRNQAPPMQLQFLGGEKAKRGELRDPPQAKRTLQDLQNVQGKTGLHVPDDLPACFPRGPWLVNMRSDPDDRDGWRAVEGRISTDLKNWASNPNTPAQADPSKWKQGGFVLKAQSRIQAIGRCGTKKFFNCTGKEMCRRTPSSRCGFTVVLEFVSSIMTDSAGLVACDGWVLKSVTGGLHQLEDGTSHDLTTNLIESLVDPVLSGGLSQLKSEPYHSLGFTLRNAGLGVSSIDQALRERAREQNHEPRWNKKQVGTHFGITVIDELLDFQELLSTIEKKVNDNPGIHHSVHYKISRLARIFSATDSLIPIVLQYGDPSHLVLTFDTTFGTNKYGMSLGFFVCPDGHGKTQVIAMALIQNEDQESITWVFEQMLKALQGSAPAVVLTDGDGKILTAITAVLPTTIHLLCLFHLWLNIRDSIRPVFRKGRQFDVKWSEFDHLFWKTSFQTTETEAEASLDGMEQALTKWIDELPPNHDILQRQAGKRGPGSRHSAADQALAMMDRLKSVKEKWIRAYTWTTFTFGAVSSQRGELAFGKFKLKYVHSHKLYLSKLIQKVYEMAQVPLQASQVQSVKDTVKTKEREQEKVHRVYRGISNGVITEYALNRVANAEAILLATSYTVMMKFEQNNEEGNCTECEFEVYSDKNPPRMQTSTAAQLSGASTVGGGSSSRDSVNNDDFSLPHTFDNPDDYCVDTGGKKLVPREVKITFCHASSTWMGECTCLAHISVGMPCRHMTACMLQMTGRKSGYAPNITMFHHVFHLTPHDVCHENIDSPAGVTSASKIKARARKDDNKKFHALRNYSLIMSVAREVGADVQDSDGDTQELIGMLRKFQQKRASRRRKNDAGQSSTQQAAGPNADTDEGGQDEGHVEMSATSSLEKMKEGDVKAPDKCKKHPKKEKRAPSRGEGRGGKAGKKRRQSESGSTGGRS
jgi:hypothetical protein